MAKSAKREKYAELYGILDGCEAALKEEEARSYPEDEYVTAYFCKDPSGKEVVYVRTADCRNGMADPEFCDMLPHPKPEAALRGTAGEMAARPRISAMGQVAEPKAISIAEYQRIYIGQLKESISQFKEIIKKLK